VFNQREVESPVWGGGNDRDNDPDLTPAIDQRISREQATHVGIHSLSLEPADGVPTEPLKLFKPSFSNKDHII